MLINHDFVLARWDGTLPVDSFKISKELSIIITPDMFLNDKNLSMIVTKNNNTILINPTETQQRQRFLVAYALGYLLNYDNKLRVHKENIMIYKNPKKSHEIMTNELIDFSLNFLVPTKILITLLKNEPSVCLSELANKFDVSQKIIEYRLKKLS